MPRLAYRWPFTWELVLVIVAIFVYYQVYGYGTALGTSSTESPCLQSKKHWYDFRHDDAELWCGKAYRPEWPAIDPGHRVPIPETVDRPMLDVQCYTRMTTYFHGESWAEVVIEMKRTSKLYDRAKRDTEHLYLDQMDSQTTLVLSVSLPSSDQAQTIQVPPLDDIPTRSVLKIDLSRITPSLDRIPITCSVRHDKTHVERLFDLHYLPPRPYPHAGSLSRLDRTTGLLQVNSTTLGLPLEQWTPIVPYGYYGAPSNLTDLVSYGFNVLHIVPGLPSDPGLGYGAHYTALLDEAARLGLWVMHDMRWTWQNSTLLTQQIDSVRDRSNLLLWYSGDEVDGTGEDPLAFATANERIKALDPFHVLSSVFNCADFMFESYTRSIDVLLTDPYPIGLFSSHSHSNLPRAKESSKGESIYGTPCNATYGCCGCDTCLGEVEDIPDAIERFEKHLDALGRRASLWIVVQGFRAQLHWSRMPSVVETNAMHLLAWSRGVTGSLTWLYAESSEAVRSATGVLATTMGRHVNVLFQGTRTTVVGYDGTDGTLWRNATHLVVAIVHTERASAQQVRLSVPGAGTQSIVAHILGDSNLTLSDTDSLTFTIGSGLRADLWSIKLVQYRGG